MTNRFGVAVFSIAAHLALGTLVIAMSLLSGDTLPTPHGALAFEFQERLVNIPRDIELPAPRHTPATPAGSTRAAASRQCVSGDSSPHASTTCQCRS